MKLSHAKVRGCVCVRMVWCVLFNFWNKSRLEFLHLCADLFYK